MFLDKKYTLKQSQHMLKCVAIISVKDSIVMKKKSLLLLIPSLIISSQLSWAESAPINLEQYYAVLDCGSSGTRIFLYQKTDAEPKLIAYAKNNIQLDTYIESPIYTAQNNIISLLNSTRPSTRQYNISKDNLQVSVLATAGMRYVPLEKQNTYYTKIKQQLISNGYKVDQVRTISGNEEALFSWISANNLNKTLDSDKDTYGIIEVGGASAQVAFATTQESGNNVYHIHTKNKNYNVYNISLLGLGKNALYRTLTQANESNICNANQTDYMQCSTAIDKIIRSYPETTQLQNLSGYTNTRFYGIDNVYYSKKSLADNFSSVDICAHTTNKECATHIYINQLIKTLAPNSIKPVSKIKSTENSWTAGFIYTKINNITITNH